MVVRMAPMDAAMTMNSRSTSLFSTDKCSTDGPLPNSQPDEWWNLV